MTFKTTKLQNAPKGVRLGMNPPFCNTFNRIRGHLMYNFKSIAVFIFILFFIRGGVVLGGEGVVKGEGGVGIFGCVRRRNARQ